MAPDREGKLKLILYKVWKEAKEIFFQGKARGIRDYPHEGCANRRNGNILQSTARGGL